MKNFSILKNIFSFSLLIVVLFSYSCGNKSKSKDNTPTNNVVYTQKGVEVKVFAGYNYNAAIGESVIDPTSLLKSSFYGPTGISINSDGIIFIGEYGGKTIKTIKAVNGRLTAALLIDKANYSKNIVKIVFDNDGNYIVAEANPSLIKKIDKNTLVITTIAGGGNLTANNTVATNVKIGSISDMVFSATNNTLYISDSTQHVIWAFNMTTNTFTRLAGLVSHPGFNNVENIADQSPLRFPSGLDLGADGNLYFAEENNALIRRINLKVTPKTIELVAGLINPGATPGYKDDADSLKAQFSRPLDIEFDSSNNLYVADTGNQVVRQVSFTQDATGADLVASGVKTFAGVQGAVDYNGGSPKNIDSTTNTINYEADKVKFNSPRYLLVKADNEIFLSDQGNNVIYLMTIH